jgi:hypothetical protein
VLHADQLGAGASAMANSVRNREIEHLVSALSDRGKPSGFIDAENASNLVIVNDVPMGHLVTHACESVLA